jgi:SWIM zinc finger
MATVAPEVRGAQPAPTPPVRHGTCQLRLVISSYYYVIKRSRGLGRHTRSWVLRKRSGPRAGAVYAVVTHKGVVTCSCPDSTHAGAVCKHVAALRAAGLVSRRALPEATLAARPEGGAS